MKPLLLLFSLFFLFGCSDDVISTPDIKCANNEIVYQTKYGFPIQVNEVDFGARLQINSYQDGYGHLVFDNDIRKIPSNAFLDNETITSIRFPNSVTSIGDYAFKGCSALSVVHFGNSKYEKLGQDIFNGCDNLQKIHGTITTSDNIGIVFNNELVFIIKNKIPSCYTIPQNATKIGVSVFSQAEQLKQISFHDNVTHIGYNAFSGCTNLSKIELPHSIIHIGDYAFGGCNNLTYTNIPNSVTYLGVYSFSGCTGVLEIDCPITRNSFMRSKFNQVYIKQNTSIIGEEAFAESAELETLVIYSGLQQINDKAFYKCLGLTDIVCYANTPPILSGNVFTDYIQEKWYSYYTTLPNIKTIKVPMGSVELYKTTNGWKSYANIITNW